MQLPLSEAAHAITGTAVNFGARTLVGLATKIEKRARSGQQPEEGDLLAAQRALDHAATELRRLTDGTAYNVATASRARTNTP